MSAVPENNTQPSPQITNADIAAGSNENDWKAKLPTSIFVPVIAGLFVVIAFFGGFGIWAATVPISGAAVAGGVIAASGLNQKVEHLEGGLIFDILVAEGDRVKINQPLVKLDPTRVLAERDRVVVALLGLQAREVRAEAERDGAREMVFPEKIQSEAASIDNENTLTQQRSEFQNRMDRHKSELQVLHQRGLAVDEEISGLEIQKQSEESKLAVIRDELEQKRDLLARGLTPRSQYNALQRAEADSLGRIGALTASIAQRKTSVLEIKQQSAGLEANRREAASKEINQLRSEISDLVEQRLTREDILTRSIIRAPTDGVVVKLSKNTVGSVVRPGEAILEILPTGSDLIIEARVAPQDIDVVRPGLEANVRFSALNTRTTPEVGATVTYVSADILIDPDTRASYYLARLQLSETLPEPLTREQIYAGMPVDTFIKTGERTFFQYLIRPITDSFNKAFREQ